MLVFKTDFLISLTLYEKCMKLYSEEGSLKEK